MRNDIGDSYELCKIRAFKQHSRSFRTVFSRNESESQRTFVKIPVGIATVPAAPERSYGNTVFLAGTVDRFCVFCGQEGAVPALELAVIKAHFGYLTDVFLNVFVERCQYPEIHIRASFDLFFKIDESKLAIVTYHA